MTDFLVLKILDSSSISLPSTQVYGRVELRSYKADSEIEIEILKESAIINRSNFDLYSYSARIATIVQAASADEAINIANNSFSEVLDLKSVEFAISSFKTSEIGFIKDLESGQINPISEDEFKPSISFVVRQGIIQRKDFVNHILSLDNELSKRYQRSLHWARNSKHENNIQLKTLFYWFSVEALVKESESDHIENVIRWFLGFPNGKNRYDVSINTLDSLKQHPQYDYWNKEIIDIMDKIRIFRNNSTHSGFRSMDFSKKELELYNKIMVSGTSRCQAAVATALRNGIKTVSEFKEYIPIIFENNKNVVNDTHGNIIFSLNQIKNSP